MKSETEFLAQSRGGYQPRHAKVYRRTENGGTFLLADGLIIGETTAFYRLCNHPGDKRKFDEWFAKTAKLCWTEVEQTK